MSDEAKAALAERSEIRAEYEAEFEAEGGESAATIVPLEELHELLGPSQRERSNKIVLAFRKRIKDADREVAEMLERESALKEQNRKLREHNVKMAAERDEWRDLHDPAREMTNLRQENAKLKAERAALGPGANP